MDAVAPDDAENDTSKAASSVLTDKQIIGLCFDFMLARHETTSNMLAFTSYLLAINPHEQDQLCQAIDDYYQENDIYYMEMSFYYYCAVYRVLLCMMLHRIFLMLIGSFMNHYACIHQHQRNL